MAPELSVAEDGLGFEESSYMATALLVLIYVAFISLGLPDALLGAAWPVMQPDLGVPYGFAGIATMVVCGGTIVSSVSSSRVLRRFGTGRVTVASVALTAVALLGYSLSPSSWWIIAAAVPLGLGAGSMDAGLNAYVAAHYASRHMSWLHSFWGIGALGGPLALSFLLSRGLSWRKGYLYIALLQTILVIILALAVPLWDRDGARSLGGELPRTESAHRSFFFPVGIRGVKPALLAFLVYCGLELTMGLWGGSFLFKVKGLDPARAATWVSIYYASITAGRFLTGFVTYRMSNDVLIRAGMIVVACGAGLMLAPLPLRVALASFVLIGLGCAPIFPCMLHETPVRFGLEESQAVMGFQMAVAYVGSTFLPPIFGFVAGATRLYLLPVFLLAYVAVLLASFQAMKKALRS